MLAVQRSLPPPAVAARPADKSRRQGRLACPMQADWPDHKRITRSTGWRPSTSAKGRARPTPLRRSQRGRPRASGRR
eukprot:968263-Alexandrium_andersonii.AAC.1